MGLLDFVKNAGEKLFGTGRAKAAIQEAEAAPADASKVKAANDAAADAIKGYIDSQGLKATGLTVNFDGATVDYDLARTSDPLRLVEEGKPPVPVRCEGPDGYIGELTHFIESIRAGKPPSVVTVDDAVSAVEICAAEEKSVLTGSAERV